MRLNANQVTPPLSPQQQDIVLPAAFVLGAAAAVNQSKSEHIEPVLSAEQGHPEAQCELGYMYSGGEGVEENKEKAFEWFKKAAEQGRDDAMQRLCDFYKDGQGVEKNLPLATYWLLKYYFESTNIDSIDGEYNQLFEFIPSILANFADFKMVDSISILFTGRIPTCWWMTGRSLS